MAREYRELVEKRVHLCLTFFPQTNMLLAATVAAKPVVTVMWLFGETVFSIRSRSFTLPMSRTCPDSTVRGDVSAADSATLSALMFLTYERGKCEQKSRPPSPSSERQGGSQTHWIQEVDQQLDP